MATYTPNYNLKKPATTDLVSIADINENMDTLDTVISSLPALTLTSKRIVEMD